jgi:hypothetical protein
LKTYTVELSANWSVDVEAENKEEAEHIAEQTFVQRISQFADFGLTVHESWKNDDDNH